MSRDDGEWGAQEYISLFQALATAGLSVTIGIAVYFQRQTQRNTKIVTNRETTHPDGTKEVVNIVKEEVKSTTTKLGIGVSVRGMLGKKGSASVESKALPPGSVDSSAVSREGYSKALQLVDIETESRDLASGLTPTQVAKYAARLAKYYIINLVGTDEVDKVPSIALKYHKLLENPFKHVKKALTKDEVPTNEYMKNLGVAIQEQRLSHVEVDGASMRMASHAGLSSRASSPLDSECVNALSDIDPREHLASAMALSAKDALYTGNAIEVVVRDDGVSGGGAGGVLLLGGESNHHD